MPCYIIPVLFPSNIWKVLHVKDYDLPISEILKFLHSSLYFLGLSFLKCFMHKTGIIVPTIESFGEDQMR